MENDLQNEIAAIKSELSGMRQDLNRFIERSNVQHLDSILKDSRKNFADIIIGYATGEIEAGLQKNMVKECNMTEACKSIFSELLKNNVEQIRDGRVSEESLDKNRSKIKKLKAKAQYDKCSKCFTEASRIFDKQIGLMRSLNVYRESSELKDAISALDVESIVDQMLDPLSNRQRMQIMKALSVETKTFSALSTLTGLRGGNLLFHLQKLLDCGMIMQRSERGDYMITERGYKSLRGIIELHQDLNFRDLVAETPRIPKIASSEDRL